MDEGVNRRTFLGGVLAMSPLSRARAASPNGDIRLGVIGVRQRGLSHVQEFGSLKGCRIAAVCDVDQAVSERAARVAQENLGYRPKIYADLRKLVEDKEVDAVTVAACNHWHALATIWACQAGKDVYVEKPASHNIWEGRKMIEAARKYNRIVQVGVQARTIRHYQRAFELLRGGAIGKIYMAKVLCYKRRVAIGHAQASAVPEGVDFDLWLGPATKRPFYANRFHYNWHWFWDTGNGDIGNQCVHEVELARYALGKTTLPTKVYSSGGKFVSDDDQETPNTQLAICDYPDCRVVFEVRGLLTGGEASIQPEGRNFMGVLYFGSEGYLSLDCFGFQMYLGEERRLAESMKYVEAKQWWDRSHMENFLQAVRSRREQDLNCRIDEGHVSAAMVHMANISYRLGRSLSFDPAAERFVGDEEANRYLTRRYRAPFAVPEKV
jgi:predicted dehydrogenase